MAGAKRKQNAGKQKGARKQQKQEGQKAVSEDINVPVDEGFTEKASVTIYIDDDGIIYDASLNQTNIGDNNNKFYNLQLLVDEDNDDQYFTHNRWGRTGEFGQTKTMGPLSLDDALEEFDKKFKSKTGLSWEDRSSEPKSKKYTFLEKNYESDDDETKVEEGDDVDMDEEATKSDLPKQTQRLMELIFNENHFNSVLEEIGYNAEKLPLGKLGEATMKTGFEHLQELASLIKHPSLAKNKYDVSQKEAIEDLSNKYYSTIPHVFGRDRAPPIDNNDLLMSEVAMLDTLTDMSVANTIMKTTTDKAHDASSVSLLDQHFNALKMDELTPLDHKSPEYRSLSKYLIDSSSQNHGLRYRLQDIFRISRPGEQDRCEKFEANLKDKNRRLLWHGTRTTNYAGILSQGLRIAPPEAPVNGYAFGKGIYLADCSSKSANYCIPGMSGGVGILLLCEAVLSRPMYEIPSGDPNAQEEAEKHNAISTLGVGRTVPGGWKDAECVHESLKGVLMPDGKPGDDQNHKGGFLQYNEYIVYNVAQLRLKYLFRVGL